MSSTTPPEKDDALVECASIEALEDAVAKDPGVWAHLALGGVRIANEGADNLAQSPLLSRVVKLILHTNNIEDKGLAALAASPHVTHVRTLDLGGNRLTHHGAAALAASSTFENLHHLEITYNHIGPAGAIALAQAKHLRTLHTLRLRDCHIRDEGLIALVTSSNLIGLREVYAFTRNEVTEDGFRVAAMSRLNRWCRTFYLEQLSTKTLKALAREHGLRGYSKLKKKDLITALLEVTRS